jgi:hypothetical protein
MIQELIMSGNVTNYKLLGCLLENLTPEEILQEFKTIVDILIKEYTNMVNSEPDITKVHWGVGKYFSSYDKERFQTHANPTKGLVYSIETFRKGFLQVYNNRILLTELALRPQFEIFFNTKSKVKLKMFKKLIIIALTPHENMD